MVVSVRVSGFRARVRVSWIRVGVSVSVRI